MYDGGLDVAGTVLTLDTVGPDFAAEGMMVKYQDVIELKADGHRTLSAQTMGADGQWHRFMTSNYRRTK